MILNAGTGGSYDKSLYDGSAYSAMKRIQNTSTNKIKQGTAQAHSTPAVNYSSTPKKPTTVVKPTVKKASVVTTPKSSAIARVASVPSGGGVVSGGGVSASAGIGQANALAKKGSDAYYTGQVAGYAKTRDQQIADISKAYSDAVAEGKMSIDEAKDAFGQAVKEINKQAYTDSQLTNVTSFSRGIQNSQQLIGLQLGDQARKMGYMNDASSERDKRIQQLNDRIANLTKQKDLDVAQAKTDYNYNITQARAEADKMLYDAQLGNLGSFSGGGSSGGGGGGSRRYSTSGSKSKSTSSNGSTGGLADEYGKYKEATQQTGLDGYNTRLNNLGKKSVVQTGYVNPIVTATHQYAPPPGMNPNVSSYDQWKILKNDFGL